ncbi:MAG TPA: TPM domain-containing protein [Gemmatimonadales bacterium]|nr:TPM domain-containing protein [Gemmatimonadales bacterium]
MLPVLAGVVILAQLAVPAPVGYVNDFAHVVDPASAQQLTDLISQVRDETKGEIAVVTLSDLGGREASDVAVQIGRQWGVGAQGAAGDPAKNLGVVILLVPRKNHQPGTGQLFLATGRGAEGFLPDARVGRIRDAMGDALSREDYGQALVVGVDSIAQAFADQFGVALNAARPPPEQQPTPARRGVPWGFLLFLLVILILTRGRILWPFLLGNLLGGGRRGGWGGGGGGGGFSGGFGGFGGGGGFSGGGAGGNF